MNNSPLYQQVYETLRERIAAGQYQRGSALPSETKLAQEFSVSQISVRRAVHELVLDGLVARRQGVGTFVRDVVRPVVVGLFTFTVDVADGRLRINRSLLADETIPAPPAIAARLSIQPAAMVRHLSRLDAEGEAPFSVDDVYTPATLANVITPDMATSPIFARLWQRASGITVARGDYELTAEMPDAGLQKLLQIGADVPVLTAIELLFDSNGCPLHLIASRYRSDRSRLASSVKLMLDPESEPVESR